MVIKSLKTFKIGLTVTNVHGKFMQTIWAVNFCKIWRQELSSLKAVTLWNKQWKTVYNRVHVSKSKLMHINTQLYINTLPLFRIFLNQKQTSSNRFFLNKNTLPLKDFLILFRENFFRSKWFRETKKFGNPWYKMY
jgi:hypothetical protein